MLKWSTGLAVFSLLFLLSSSVDSDSGLLHSCSDFVPRRASPDCPQTDLSRCLYRPLLAVIEDGKCCPNCGERVNLTCEDEDGVHLEGAQWFPSVVPPVEVIVGGLSGLDPRFTCITCSCDSGGRFCSDLRRYCKSPRCNHPIVEPGKCCPFCPTEGSGGSGEDNAAIYLSDQTEACTDEQNVVRDHGECWSLVYGGQTTCMEVCCNDSRVLVTPPDCPPVRPCDAGQPAYGAALACCPQCSRGPVIAPKPAGEEFHLKECVGDLPFKIYLYKRQFQWDGRDSMAYALVNDPYVTILVFKLVEGRRFFVQSKVTWEKLLSRPSGRRYVFRGRTTSEKMTNLLTGEEATQSVLACRSDCARLMVSLLEPTKRPSCATVHTVQ